MVHDSFLNELCRVFVNFDMWWSSVAEHWRSFQNQGLGKNWAYLNIGMIDGLSNVTQPLMHSMLKCMHISLVS